MSWAKRITNKSEYLYELKNHLARLPDPERADILRDQEEFFREATLSGRTEADVIGSLGDPKQLAKTLIAESRIAASENAFKTGEELSTTASGAGTSGGANPSFSTQMNATLRAFFAIITLAPFNLIFVLGPFLALMGCLFAGWAIGAASLFAGFAGIFFIASELTGVGASLWAQVSSTFLALGVIVFSVAFLGLMTWLSSWVARISVRYMRWNLDLIVERSK